MSGARRKQAAIASIALFLVGPVLPFAMGPVERILGTAPSWPKTNRDLPEDPVIEVIVPAYLESSTIGATIADLEETLVRADLRHVVHVVASDETTAAAASRAGRLTRTSRSGKPSAINLAVARSSADIIVLTDANCQIHPVEWPTITLCELTRCDLLSGNKTEPASSESLFWRFESWVKRANNTQDGTLAVVGEFLAFRRSHFRPIPATTMTDDLWLALDFHARGLTVRTSEAIATSEEPARRAQQWERRVRIAMGVLTEALPRAEELAGTPAGRHYMSHKLYRVTIGACAFWTAVVTLVNARPRIMVPALGLPIVACVALYRGLIEVKTPLDPVVAIVGMQAAPVTAAWRIVRQRAGRRGHRPAGWEKVPR